MSKLRVFLADDHPIVRDGLRALVEAQPDMEIVGEAADGRSISAEAARARPDVVLMDLSMPGVGGLEATAEVRRANPGVRVLVLTAQEDAAYLQQALAAGAAGYVLKRTAAADLVHAIRRVVAGETYLDPGVAGQVVTRLMQEAAAPPPGALSDREAEVLRLVALGHLNKQIAAQLDLSIKTVETYKARAMEKLDLKSRVEVVRYAVRVGWIAN